jgi:hypothetical protein
LEGRDDIDGNWKLLSVLSLALQLCIWSLYYRQASNFCACADVDLLKISVLKNSLCYINIRNCTLLTDGGISNFLLRCTKIHSMVLSYTSFGNWSIQTLHYMTVNIQELHLSGCKGKKQQLCLMPLIPPLLGEWLLI